MIRDVREAAISRMFDSAYEILTELGKDGSTVSRVAHAGLRIAIAGLLTTECHPEWIGLEDALAIEKEDALGGAAA